MTDVPEPRDGDGRDIPSYDPSQYGTPDYGRFTYPAPVPGSGPHPGRVPSGREGSRSSGSAWSLPGFAGLPDPWAPYGRDPATGTPLSDRSKRTACLLQMFLGGFGAGRFYLGHSGVAIAQLLTLTLGWGLLLSTPFGTVGFFVLLGLGAWTLIDAITMLSGGVRDGRGLVLRI